jgi:uncharacterized protein
LRFSNAFDVALPPDQAWATLMDIRQIVTCMPGAELTEQVDDRTFKGKVSVRLGPMAMAFAGTARFEEVDEAAHRAKVKAQGNDAKGRGAANATVTFSLEPSATGSRVAVDTDLNLSGAVAQYGRASGLIQGVATQLTNEFARALSARVAAAHDASPASAQAAAGGEAIAGSRASSPTPAAKPIGGVGLLLRALWAAVRQRFGRAR